MEKHNLSPHIHLKKNSTLITTLENDKLPPIQPATSSFHMCESCQTTLLNSFNHCLFKQMNNMKEYNLPSIYDYDEEAASIPISEAPQLPIVKDVSLTIKHHDVEFMGTLLNPKGKKQDKESLPTTPQWETKESLPTTPQWETEDLEKMGETKATFPILKKMIQSKNKEIALLKQKLYESSLMGRMEHSNADKLQRALGKAVKYYAQTEDWKAQETKQLKDHIVSLKCYVSSLMSIIVTTDNHRSNLEKRVAYADSVLVHNERIIEEGVLEIQSLKEKMKESFGEYLDLSSEFDELRKNSTSIKELQLSQEKLEAIRQQYQAVSKDLVHSTKSLEDTSVKNRQLEFELEELVRQFNQLGEDKINVDREHMNVKGQLISLSKEHSELKSQHNEMTGFKNMAENELRKLRILHAKSEEESKMKQTSDTIKINDLEAKNKILNETNTTNNQQISTLQQINRNISTKLKQLEEKHELSINISTKEIASKDALLQDLQIKFDVTTSEYKNQKAQKENKMVRIHELESALEIESNAAKSLQLELKEIVQVLEDIKLSSNDESVRLNRQKDSLTREKLVLAEEVRDLRDDIEVRDATIRELEKSHRLELQDYDKKHIELKQELNTIISNLDSTTENKNKLVLDLHTTKDLLSKTRSEKLNVESILETKTKMHQSLTNEFQTLTFHYNQLKLDKASLETSLESTTNRLDATMTDLNITSGDYRTYISETQEKVKNLTNQIIKLEDIIRKYEIIIESNTKTLYENNELIIKLKEALSLMTDRFEMERMKHERDLAVITDIQITLLEERSMREEIQQVLFRKESHSTSQTKIHIESVLLKKSLLDHIGLSLFEEHNRLDKFIGLIDDELFKQKKM